MHIYFALLENLGVLPCHDVLQEASYQTQRMKWIPPYYSLQQVYSAAHFILIMSSHLFCVRVCFNAPVLKFTEASKQAINLCTTCLPICLKSQPLTKSSVNPCTHLSTHYPLIICSSFHQLFCSLVPPPIHPPTYPPTLSAIYMAATSTSSVHVLYNCR